MAHAYVIVDYDSHLETETIRAVALMHDSAEAFRALCEEQAIAYGLDTESEADDWRSDLIEKGVPAEIVDTLTPPASVFDAARARIAESVTKRRSWRVLQARLT